MSAITLAQALAASEAVDDLNTSVNNLNDRLTEIQATLAQLNSLNVSTAINQANAQLSAVQALIAARQADLTTQTATISAYNQANPGSPIAVG